MSSLKIGTINVCSLDKRKTLWIESLLADEVDIVIVTETALRGVKPVVRASKYFVFIANAGFNVGTPRPHGGIAIFAKPSLHSSITSRVGHSPFLATFNVGTLKIAGVYAAPKLTLQEFQTLLQSCRDCDLILGDFNAPPSPIRASYYHAWTGSRDRLARSGLIQPFLHDNGKKVASIPCPGAVTSSIDHILVSTRLKFYDYVWMPPTLIPFRPDHGYLSVTLDFAVPHTAVHAARRFKLAALDDPIKADNFVRFYRLQMDIMDPVMEQLQDSLMLKPTIDRTEAQWMVNSIDYWMTSSIVAAGNVTVGSYLPGRGTPRTDLLEEALAQTESALAAANQYLRRIKTQTKSATLVSDRPGQTAINAATDSFTKLYTSSHPPPPAPGAVILVNHDHVVQQKLIKQCITKYPVGKAPGPDGISAKLYRVLIDAGVDSNMQLHFKRLYRIIFMTGITPARWNTSLVFPIPKGEVVGGEFSVANSRGISLTCMARRYFESYLLSTMKSLSLVNHHPNQAGFRNKYSTWTNAILAQISKSQVQVYLDLEKAYDRLDHAYSLQLWSTLGFPSCLVSTLRFLMLTNCSSILLVNGQLTNSLPRTCGLFQGSILSPCLFNLAMDELGRRLDTISPVSAIPSFLFYADDIRLQLPDVNLPVIQDMLTLIQEWGHEAGLKVNIAKSAVTRAPVLGSSHEQVLLLVHAQPLPLHSSYKYLGFNFTSAGIDWEATWTHYIKRATAALDFLFAVGANRFPHIVKQVLVKSRVLGVLRYPIGLWSMDVDSKSPAAIGMIGSLNTLHDKVLKFVFGFGNERTRVILSDLVSCPAPAELANLAANQLHHHVNRMPQDSHLSKYLADHYLDCRLLRKLHYDPVQTADVKSKILRDRRATSRYCLYIPDSSRFKATGMDRLIACKAEDTRVLGIQFRTGFLFRYLDDDKVTCPSCSKQFTRAHSNSCVVLDRFLSAQLRQQFSDARSRLGRDGTNFTILDYLLNCGFYDLFKQIVDWLSEFRRSRGAAARA